MAFEVFQTVSAAILKYGQGFAKVSDTFVTMVTPAIQAGLALVILLHGYRIIRGEGGQHHMLDVFSRCLRAFLVFSLALAAGMYEQNVHQFIVNIGNDVVVGFGGDPEANKYKQIDLAMEKGFAAFRAVVNWGREHIGAGFIYIDLSGVWAILAGAVMIVIILVLGVVACFELLVIDFGLFIIFGVGPLFVACYAFEATARFFDTWLSGVLKWVFTSAVITVTVLMSVSMLDNFVIELSKGGTLNQVLIVILTASAAVVILILIVYRAPTIATDLVGGIGLNSAAQKLGSAVQSKISSMMKKDGKGANGANGAPGGGANGGGPGGMGAKNGGGSGQTPGSGMAPGPRAVTAAANNTQAVGAPRTAIPSMEKK
ncbi:type IV secretion system protein [Massilia sp. erpn]|uniref:type IV secretion system protein n=1 Tax=Massilia sp. erpn TaxID=2738142 RepID=UPI002105A9F2|nr:type IV secretion system protein [Massilia sp. erpn]UTY59671.1 type IV secretion system protein [Massilia sp. erpn]